MTSHARILALVLLPMAVLGAARHPGFSCPTANGKSLVTHETASQWMHLSFAADPDLSFTWTEGRNYCQKLCMDLVSVENDQDWKELASIFYRTPSLRYLWTSGRKCNFEGCDKPRFRPAIERGWFWAASLTSIPNPFEDNACTFCHWGYTGALGRRQPDNRQGVLEGKDEGCLAVLNNLYGDGLKWHDVACHHRKPVLCQKRK